MVCLFGFYSKALNININRYNSYSSVFENSLILWFLDNETLYDDPLEYLEVSASTLFHGWNSTFATIAYINETETGIFLKYKIRT